MPEIGYFQLEFFDMRKEQDILGPFEPNDFLRKYVEDNPRTRELYNKVEDKPFTFIINKIDDFVNKIEFPTGQSLRTDNYEVFFITEGYSKLEYNLHLVKQVAGEIRFAQPGSIATMLGQSDQLKGYFLLFAQNFISLLNEYKLVSNLSFFFTGSKPVFKLSKELKAKVTQTFDYLIELYQEPDYDKKSLIICSYVTTILLEIDFEFRQ